MARQAALLLLTVHGYEIPNAAVPNDFYRQALELDLRSKREYTEAILAAMGGIDKGHLYHYKALLRLSDEAVELADRHDIDERKLRHVITAPQELHTEIIRQIVDFNLTSKQVKELCESDAGVADPVIDDRDAIPASAMKIARITKTSSETSAQDLVRALLKQEQDPNLARARLHSYSHVDWNLRI